MKLEHYSNQENLMEEGIHPKFHGTGVRGAESKRKQDPHWVDRSYHYVAGTQPESMLSTRPHVYSSEVPDDKIYDYHKDPLNLARESKDWGAFSPTLYEKNIKNSGYLGFRNPAAQGMDHVVALFHPIKPHAKRSKGDLDKSNDNHYTDLFHDGHSLGTKRDPDIGFHKEHQGVKYSPSKGVYYFKRPGSNKMEYAKADNWKEFHNVMSEEKIFMDKTDPWFSKRHVARGIQSLEKDKKTEQAKVWGDNPNPGRMSEKRIKMMRHIRDVVQHVLGVDLTVAKGKIDTETGKLKTPVSELPEHKKPYDIFTDEGVEAEKQRLATVAEENKNRPAIQGAKDMPKQELYDLRRKRAREGVAPKKRMDPKPDWRSGELQTQPSPDAAIHEIAHVMTSEKGLGDTQEEMDHQFGQVIAHLGFLKQKATQGEIQPMAMENKIRRIMGLPANKQSQNPKPMSEHNRPVEHALDQPTPRFVRGVAQTKQGPVSVDLIRQTKLLSPKNSEKFDKFIRGEIKFHPEKGWVPGESVNAKINQRARAAANELDPDKYFARKDKDTLMRSEMQKSDYNKHIARKIKELKDRYADKKEPTTDEQVRAVKAKYTKQPLKKQTGMNVNVGAAKAIGAAFGGGSKPPPAPPTPSGPSTASSGGLGGMITSGLKRLGMSQGSNLEKSSDDAILSDPLHPKHEKMRAFYEDKLKNGSTRHHMFAILRAPQFAKKFLSEQSTQAEESDANLTRQKDVQASMQKMRKACQQKMQKKDIPDHKMPVYQKGD